MLKLETLEARENPAYLFLSGHDLIIHADPKLGSTVTVNPNSTPGDAVVTWQDGTGSPQTQTFHNVNRIDFQAGPGGSCSLTDNTPYNDSYAGGHCLNNTYYGGTGVDAVMAGLGFNFIETRSTKSSTIFIPTFFGGFTSSYGEIISLGVHTSIYGSTNGYFIYNP